MQSQRKGSIFWASVWMLVLSLLLFWLPAIGSLIAGVVGGKIAGSPSRAFWASILPSLLLGVLLALLATILTGMPIVGVIAGLGAFTLAVIGAGTMVIGALIGGLLA